MIAREEGFKVFEDYEFTPQDERKKAGDNNE